MEKRVLEKCAALKRVRESQESTIAELQTQLAEADNTRFQSLLMVLKYSHLKPEHVRFWMFELTLSEFVPELPSEGAPTEQAPAKPAPAIGKQGHIFGKPGQPAAEGPVDGAPTTPGRLSGPVDSGRRLGLGARSHTSEASSKDARSGRAPDLRLSGGHCCPA